MSTFSEYRSDLENSNKKIREDYKPEIVVKSASFYFASEGKIEAYIRFEIRDLDRWVKMIDDNVDTESDEGKVQTGN